MGTPSKIDWYDLKKPYTKNGAFIHPVTIFWLSCPTIIGTCSEKRSGLFRHLSHFVDANYSELVVDHMH